MLKWVTRVYVVSGLVASYLAFVIESSVLSDFLATADPLFPWAAAAVFEVVKVLTVVLYRHQMLSERSFPASVGTAVWVLRAGLLGFGLFANVVFFSRGLVAPNEEALRLAEIELVTRAFDRNIAEVTKRIDKTVADLEREVKSEMNNVRNGTFVGERYREFTRRMEDAKAARIRELERLNSAKAKAIAEARSRRYDGDSRVRNRTLEGLVLVAKSVTRIRINYQIVVLMLAFVTGTLLELAIWVCFEISVVSVYATTAALHREDGDLKMQIGLWQAISDKRMTLELLKLKANQSLKFIKNLIQNGGTKNAID